MISRTSLQLIFILSSKVDHDQNDDDDELDEKSLTR